MAVSIALMTKILVCALLTREQHIELSESQHIRPIEW